MRRVGVVIGVAAACLLVVSMIAVPFVFEALFGTQDGDQLAEQRVVGTADALEEDLGYFRDSRDAESIAAERFQSTASDVTPVAWSGSTERGGEATIDVRIRAQVEALGGGFGNGRANTAGSAERCYRFTLVIHQYAQRNEIDCVALPPDGEPPRAAPLAALPEDAASRVESLLQTFDPADPVGLSQRLRVEFPDPEISIDTARTEEGEVVVAVGAEPSRDCVVGVRTVDGGILPVSFDRIWLEPGEGGCTVRLYTSPPL